MKINIIASVIICLTIFFSSNSSAAVRTVTTSGNWSNPAIWSDGTVPVCGDYVIVPAGLTLNINVQVDFRACSPTYFQVYGTIQFISGNKIRLACGSGVEIMPGGRMLSGGGGGSSNELEICNNVLWKASDGPVDGYRLFGNPIPLATEFVDFEANIVSDKTQFSWIVKSERNNDFFKIEYSADGEVWEAVLTKESIGDHNEYYTYSTEIDLVKNQGYYRLSVTDLSGEKTFLKKVFVKREKAVFQVYPNPVADNGNLTIIYPSDRKKEISLEIINIYGQVVDASVLQADAGFNEFVWNMEQLDSGIYIFRIKSD